MPRPWRKAKHFFLWKSIMEDGVCRLPARRTWIRVFNSFFNRVFRPHFFTIFPGNHNQSWRRPPGIYYGEKIVQATTNEFVPPRRGKNDAQSTLFGAKFAEWGTNSHQQRCKTAHNNQRCFVRICTITYDFLRLTKKREITVIQRYVAQIRTSNKRQKRRQINFIIWFEFWWMRCEFVPTKVQNSTQVRDVS